MSCPLVFVFANGSSKPWAFIGSYTESWAEA